MKKRFAIIGVAGYVAPRHLKAIKETGNILIAAMDRSDSVGVLDQYFPETAFFTEFERFERHLVKLKNEGLGIDYLVVCTPNYLHDAHVRFGLRLGADVITHIGNEKEILKQLTDSFLYKDILILEQIKKPEKIVKLLQALAFRVGSQISYSEIGQKIGLDSKTVEKYILVLEQSYVIFRLSSFSRNLRNELKNSKKIYFYDNGVRNALIANFEIAETRSDIGKLWENFLVAERIKKLTYENIWSNYWFWRTKEQKEIDFIEEGDGKITAYEFKWNPNAKVKSPKAFTESYTSDFKVITPKNYEEFLL